MPLYTYPEIKDMSRAELDLHVAATASKRMQAAILYQKEERGKLSKEASVIDGKLDRKYQQLSRVLERMAGEEAKATKLMNEIDALRQQMDITITMMSLYEVEED